MGAPGSGASSHAGERPTVLAGRAQLRSIVARLAAEIDQAHPEGVVLVGVLKGSVPFVADLVRSLSVPSCVDFLALSRFAPDSGRVRILKDLDIDVAGRDVVLVEGIVDTGLSLGYLLGELARREPASLEVCALVDKSARRILPVPICYCGIEVDDGFVLGYGLDFAGRYRNLELLAVGDSGALARDPDRYVASLYR